MLVVSSAIPLSGCSDFHGSIKAYKNPTLMWTEADYEGSFEKFDRDAIIRQYNNHISFGILICQNGCGACNDFKPIIKDYLKNTKQLIYKMNITEQQDEFNWLIQYHYYDWFEGKAPKTPSVFMIHDENIAEEIPYSKFGTIYSFTNAMRDTISLTNCYYSLEEVDLEKVVNNISKNMIYFTINTEQTFGSEIFKTEIKPLIETTNKQILIIDNDNYVGVKSYTLTEVGGRPELSNEHTYDLDIEAGRTYLKSLLN